MKKIGLYIHVPFCAGKCAYCDFYSVKAGAKVHAAYAGALAKQMQEYGLAAKGFAVGSIYIGGGTPTVIGAGLLAKIIKNMKGNFELARDAEFTVEANPASIDLKGLKKLRKAGANRLSLGLQSVHGRELRALSRKYKYADFLECYNSARAAGFDNISVDVMYGVPTQDAASFYESLERVASLAPEHISAYGLKIEPGTRFHANLAKIREYMPGEEAERDMYFMCCDFLEGCGYGQYEISNFARPGYECRHNLGYWTCGEYIGLGPGAHSYFAGSRFSFKRDVKEYISNFDGGADRLADVDVFDLGEYNLFDEYLELKPSERIGEYIMLNFRLRAGISKSEFARLFLRDFDDLYYLKVEPFIKSGHIAETQGGYAFTRAGMLVSNYILGRIVEFD